MGGSRTAGKPGRGSRKAAEPQGEYHARSASEIAKEIKRMEEQMFQHARDLEFEQAAAHAGSDPAVARRVDRVMSGKTRWLIWRRLRRLYAGLSPSGHPLVGQGAGDPHPPLWHQPGGSHSGSGAASVAGSTTSPCCWGCCGAGNVVFPPQCAVIWNGPPSSPFQHHTRHLSL